MRKLLLAGVITLAPFAAFATVSGPANNQIGTSVVGDVNAANTAAGSTAGVNSTQGTHAGVSTAGNGGVSVGAVSGNSASVNSSASGTAGPGGSSTNRRQREQPGEWHRRRYGFRHERWRVRCGHQHTPRGWRKARLKPLASTGNIEPSRDSTAVLGHPPS